MNDKRIYETIAEKSGGNIYIGVVGPVRTGKSTFIHKFMENAVLPNISDENERARTKDELPQSGSGRTVTTTEPKFIPSNAVKVNFGGTDVSLRLVDCVGFVVDGAAGIYEGESMRMVNTPWAENAIPFSEAAEEGTLRVAREHSGIAVLVTTDGSICDIPRDAYISAEERAVKELTDAGKPFAIVLNSAVPETEDALRLAESLEEKYGVPVALINCMRLNSEDIEAVLSMIIGEFPIKMLTFTLPDWVGVLDEDHRIRRDLKQMILGCAEQIKRISDVERVVGNKNATFRINSSDGTADIAFELGKNELYSAIYDISGVNIECDKDLLLKVREMAEAKNEYDKIRDALTDVKEKGYGIVMPTAEDLTISEPTLQKQSDGYGIKLSAVAGSIHMIRADLKTEICPVVGAQEQAAEVVRDLTGDYEEDPRKLLETKMFGRSLYDMVSDGMQAKLTHLPDVSREKLGQTLEKIVNDGANGLICILL